VSDFEPQQIISELGNNIEVFESMFHVPGELRTWRPAEDKWSMQEILCHLIDEEREDFRARVRSVLTDPNEELKKIDPHSWVEERRYMQQDYDQKLREFLAERQESVEWLESLHDARWENTYQHPILGPMSAKLFLCNWLAHDYLHIRQMTRTKRLYLLETSEESLDYAGDW
jgi:hypothetical protein